MSESISVGNGDLYPCPKHLTHRRRQRSNAARSILRSAEHSSRPTVMRWSVARLIPGDWCLPEGYRVASATYAGIQSRKADRMSDGTKPLSNASVETEFVLRLRPISGAGWSDPAWRRLKGLLKVSLRRFGLKCIALHTTEVENLKTDQSS